jgi:microcystin-dependent protein
MSDFKAVQLKRSVVVDAIPAANELVDGELAINLINKKLYSKYNTVFQVVGAIEDNTITTIKIQDDAITTPKLSASAIAALVSAALAAVYPIGSIYTSTIATDPATTFGFGTWVAFGAGKVLIGQDTGDTSFDVLEETGGSKDAIIPYHNHPVTDPGHAHAGGRVSFLNSGIAGGGNDTTSTVGNTSTAFTSVAVSFVGEPVANKNLQPYVVVKMWKRTA